MKLIKLSLLSITFLALASCGNSEETPDTDNTNTLPDTDINTEMEEAEEKETFNFVPPTPIQIASIFKKAGLEFNDSYLNPVSQASEYNDKFIQSLNFGVYSADLAYCVKNEKNDKASEYLGALKKLSGKIGLETVFESGDLVERFKNNIGNQDSIVGILFYIQDNTDNYIDQNGKNDLSVIYYAGAWIEGMYLGAKNALENPEMEDLGLLLSEQMTIGKSIHKGLNYLDNPNNDTEDLADSIEEIVNMYENAESVKELGEEAEFLDVYLTSEEVEKISGAIIELRNSITE